MKKILLLIQMLFLITIVSYSQLVTIDNIVYNLTPFAEVEVIRHNYAKGDIIILDKVMISGKEFTVTSIKDEAFLNLSRELTGVVIPNSVISIGNSSFRLNKLANITIGNSVKEIGNNAFEGNKLTSITIPESVINIGNYAFYQNQLTSVTIPNNVNSIGSAVFNGNQLTSIIIGNNVNTIGNSAFGNNLLENVTIPKSVKTIEDLAFSNNLLTSVIVEHTTPLAISNNVFFKNFIPIATLYVPAGTKEAYESANGWKDFGNIVESVVTEINHKNTESEIKVYPNPAVNRVNVSISDASFSNNYKLELRNIASTLLWEQTINTSDYSIDVSSLEGKGLYFISIFKENGELIDVRKIVLE